MDTHSALGSIINQFDGHRTQLFNVVIAAHQLDKPSTDELNEYINDAVIDLAPKLVQNINDAQMDETLLLKYMQVVLSHTLHYTVMYTFWPESPNEKCDGSLVQACNDIIASIIKSARDSKNSGHPKRFSDVRLGIYNALATLTRSDQTVADVDQLYSQLIHKCMDLHVIELLFNNTDMDDVFNHGLYPKSIGDKK